MKSKIASLLEIKQPFKTSDVFHESVKISSFPKNPKGVMPKSWVKIYYKTYPRLKKIILPKPTKFKANLNNLIISRRSKRKFANTKITIKDLSSLLFYSAGITQIKENNINTALRAYPSAGARYPLEIYLIANRVNKLEKGIYHYNVKEHGLETLRSGDFSNIIGKFTSQKLAKKANLVVIISAIFDRTRIKYGNRGYRFPFIEAGHLAQNLYLISEAQKLNCCTIGGFIDDKINKLLDFSDTCEKVIYIATIGSRHEFSKIHS